jgi:hypothetical protein
MKIRECILLTDLIRQIYLCCVIYSAAYFVVGLIAGARSFTATSTSEMVYSGRMWGRSQVTGMSKFDVCTLRN